MEILSSIAAVRAWHDSVAGSVGFVPTMGALHDGHIALVRAARTETERVLVSIFINPTQFSPQEDLECYPRDLDSDLAQLRAAGVAAVFTPSSAEIYPEGFVTSVQVTGPLTEVLEGAARPSHFQGVVTVVAKLFAIAQPTRAYFGMKDAQQLLVVAKLVRDLALPLTIVPVATEREPDGLAMSSRNRNLSEIERAAAGTIPRALAAGRAHFAAGERQAAVLRAVVQAELDAAPLIQVEYVSCAALDSLRELEEVQECGLLSLAVRIGETRLIDNCWLGIAAGASPLPAS